MCGRRRLEARAESLHSKKERLVGAHAGVERLVLSGDRVVERRVERALQYGVLDERRVLKDDGGGYSG